MGSRKGGGGETEENARYKAEILTHPLYEQLLSAHVSCLLIATPVDQLLRIDAQLAQSHHVVGKYSVLGGGGGNQIVDEDEKELGRFVITINNTDNSSLEENHTQGQVVNDEVDKKTTRDTVVTTFAVSIFGMSGSYVLQLMGYSFIMIALVIVALIISFGIIVHPKIRDSAFLTLVSKLISSTRSHITSLGNMCRSRQQVSFDTSNPGNQENQPVPVSKTDQVSLGMELRKNHFIDDAPTRVAAADPRSDPSTLIDRDSSESSESNNINDADMVHELRRKITV